MTGEFTEPAICQEAETAAGSFIALFLLANKSKTLGKDVIKNTGKGEAISKQTRIDQSKRKETKGESRTR